MVDRAVDAVGYQAVDKDGSKEQPNIVLDQLIMVTRPTGGLVSTRVRNNSHVLNLTNCEGYSWTLCTQ